MGSVSLMEVSFVLHVLKVCLLKILMNCESSNFTGLYAQTSTFVSVAQGLLLKMIIESFWLPFSILVY